MNATMKDLAATGMSILFGDAKLVLPLLGKLEEIVVQPLLFLDPVHLLPKFNAMLNFKQKLSNSFQVHSSLKGAGKTFATPGKPKPATPGSRRALKEKNETFVRGMTKASIASVDGNIFNAADIASSTMKADQIVSTIFPGIIAFYNFKN